MEKKILIFWICNEFIQGLIYYCSLNVNFYLKFFVIHFSSFCAGYLFTRLFKKYNIEKYIFLIIVVQLLYNLIIKDAFDFIDILFLVVGITLGFFQDYIFKKIF